MGTIKSPTGEIYLSVFDNGACIKMRLHHYEEKIFLTLDKRCLPELIKELSKYEGVRAVNKTTEGYWCVFCQKFIEADEYGVVVHDDVDHDYADFNEEMKPQ